MDENCLRVRWVWRVVEFYSITIAAELRSYIVALDNFYNEN